VAFQGYVVDVIVSIIDASTLVQELSQSRRKMIRHIKLYSSKYYVAIFVSVWRIGGRVKQNGETQR
jgi:hypothetical protein